MAGQEAAWGPFAVLQKTVKAYSANNSSLNFQCYQERISESTKSGHQELSVKCCTTANSNSSKQNSSQNRVLEREVLQFIQCLK